MQQTEGLGSASARPLSLELHSHVTATGPGVCLPGGAHDSSHSSWGDSPASHKKPLCSIDYSDPAMYPDTFLCHGGPSLSGQTSEHESQWNLPVAAKPHLAQTASASTSSAIEYHTGASLLGPASPPQQQHQQQRAGDPPALERLGIRELQQLLGMSVPSKDMNPPRKQQLHDRQWDAAPATGNMSRTLLPQKRQHASFSPQLYPCVSAAMLAGKSALTGFRQPSAPYLPADSQSTPWPQPTSLGAVTSQHASSTGMHAHAASAHVLLQHQGAFLQPVQPNQNALQGARDAAARRPSGLPSRYTWDGQSVHESRPEPSPSFSLPFGPVSQSSSLTSAEGVDSSSRLSGPPPSKARLLAACSNQAASALSNQTSLHRPTLLASSSEQLSQGGNPSMGGPLRPNPWLSLANRASAPSLHEASPAAGACPSRSSLQGTGLPTLSSVGSSSDDVQRCQGPDAMHNAAQVLNTQLALIDKQVLEHIVPCCGQQGKGGSKLSDAYNIQKQVP